MRILIQNGTLVDPLSHIHSKLNLYIADGIVAAVTTGTPEADIVLDATGKIVAPGFIDAHMHEGAYFGGKRDDSVFLSLLQMGVTTGIGGNCGNNSLPSPSDYLKRGETAGFPIHLALFVGHSDQRILAGGKNKYTPVSKDILDRMLKNIRKELEAGCIGVSYGVRYSPGTTKEELRAVSALCKEYQKPISAHVRDDAAGVFESVREIADIAVELSIPVQISHIGSMGGFGQMQELLQCIDTYRANGLDIACDCYPYTAFSTEIGETTYDDGWLERYQTDYSSMELCDGKYKGKRCTKEWFEELRATAPETITVCHVMKPQDVFLALLHPNVMLATDSFMHNGQGHPRAAGSFPKFFHTYVKSGKISLDAAIYKTSGMAAQCFGLTKKGRLSAGSDADVVIFDPNTIKDCATFEQPALPPQGISYVLLNGQIAVNNGKTDRSNLGKPLYFL